MLKLYFRHLVAAVFGVAVLGSGCDVQIVDEQSDRFACDEDDDCLDGYVCSFRAGVNVCVPEAQANQDVSGDATTDTSETDTNVPFDIPDDLPVDIPDDFPIDIPIDIPLDAEDTRDSMAGDTRDAQDGTDTADTIGCAPSCPNSVTVQLFAEGDDITANLGETELYLYADSVGGVIDFTNFAAEPWLSEPIEVGFDVNANDAIEFTVDTGPGEVASATTTVGVGDGDRVLLLAAIGASGELQLAAINVDSNLFDDPNVPELGAVSALAQQGQKELSVRELRSTVTVFAPLLEVPTPVGSTLPPGFVARFYVTLADDLRRRLATFDIPIPENDSIWVATGRGTEQPQMAVIHVGPTALSLEVYRSIFEPECVFSGQPGDCPNNRRCLPHRRVQGGVLGVCTSVGNTPLGDLCDSHRDCGPLAACAQAPERPAGTTVCQPICDPVSPSACAGTDICHVVEPGTIWGVCQLANVANSACRDPLDTASTCTDGYMCQADPIQIDVGTCVEDGPSDGSCATEPCREPRKFACNEIDRCEQICVRNTTVSDFNCTSACAPLMNRGTDARGQDIIEPGWRGFCSDQCEYTSPACTDGQTCLPAWYLDSTTATGQDVCVPGSDGAVGDPCGAVPRGQPCGLNGVCAPNLQTGDMTCRRLCNTSAAGFGVNHPNCPSGFCLNLLGRPDAGVCVPAP